MEVQGKVKLIGKNQSFGTKGFVKAELIVETDGDYPQPINIEFTGDNTDFLAKLSVGDLVKVSINLRGREWVSPEGVVKYFNSIQGWKVDVIESVEKEDF
mgnify:CR=1 FL=1|jgi:hypothetical protein|tara:strand:+ start:816 stop:1115 length:300 start_codon:yes stop_codon:yes gene_type:complete